MPIVATPLVWPIVGKPTAATVVGVICVLLLAAVTAFGSLLGGRELGRRAQAGDGRPAEPSVAAAATAGLPSTSAPAVPAVDKSALTAAITPFVHDPRLGGELLASVVDETSASPLFDLGATRAAAPASTAKLATATATLVTHAPADRIRTAVVAGAQPGVAVLVGAGDPTLSAAPAGSPTLYKDAARISDLAAQLRSAGITKIEIDGSLFDGPAVATTWLPGDVPSDYASAITALMVDGGRDNPAAATRSAAPDMAAGQALATQLGLPPSAVTTGSAPAGATVLASVQSGPYSELVRQMLQDSDNVIAEVLGRQVALVAHQPATFAGAAAAIHGVLAGLGVDDGAGMLDASGLSPGDRLAPATLTAVLRLADDAAHPTLGAIAASLPVAGWSGTLASRYLDGASRSGAIHPPLFFPLP